MKIFSPLANESICRLTTERDGLARRVNEVTEVYNKLVRGKK